MKRTYVIGAVVFFVLLGGFFLWQKRAASANKNGIETSRASRGVLVKTVTSSGKTKADTSAELKFQTSGRLSWVKVKEGDTVSAYQAIAGLDVREVQKTLDKTLRDYSNERNDFEETWRVTYLGVRNPSTALTDTAKRILEKNQWDLEKAVLDVELKHLAVEYATLVTPIAGVVAHIDTPVAGVNITPATAVFEIVDPKSLVFSANIDEGDVGNLILGQTASVALDAFPEASFSGKVTYISYVAETSAGGATVFPVKVAFDEPQALRIGLNGDVSIEVLRQEDVLTIPIEAIREEKSEKYVYKKEGDAYSKTPVTVGAQNEDSVVIRSGLSDNDTVVTRGFANIPKHK